MYAHPVIKGLVTRKMGKPAGKIGFDEGITGFDRETLFHKTEEVDSQTFAVGK